jgi:ribosomal protein S18 acetylase RimI-like enzyme
MIDADGGAGRRAGMRHDDRVTVDVQRVAEADDDVVAALTALLPQLSSTAEPPTADGLASLVAHPSVTLLVARVDDRIVGTLTLIRFPLPTGERARIEDVVVDESARGQGVGAALTLEALRLAEEFGVRTVDLTSRPTRLAANRLYRRLGFQERDSRVYRYPSDH